MFIRVFSSNARMGNINVRRVIFVWAVRESGKHLIQFPVVSRVLTTHYLIRRSSRMDLEASV